VQKEARGKFATCFRLVRLQGPIADAAAAMDKDDDDTISRIIARENAIAELVAIMAGAEALPDANKEEGKEEEEEAEKEAEEAEEGKEEEAEGKEEEEQEGGKGR